MSLKTVSTDTSVMSHFSSTPISTSTSASHFKPVRKYRPSHSRRRALARRGRVSDDGRRAMEQSVTSTNERRLSLAVIHRSSPQPAWLRRVSTAVCRPIELLQSPTHVTTNHSTFTSVQR